MQLFLSLVKYEFLKLLKRRMVCVTLAVSAAVMVLGVTFGGRLGRVYVEGELITTQADLDLELAMNSKRLSGRVLDETMTEELREAYRQAGEESQGEIVYLAEPYRKYIWPLEPFVRWVRRVGLDVPIEDLNEETLYAKRLERMEENWSDSLLSEGEKEYLRGQNEKLETPFTYEYCFGYEHICDMMNTTAFVLVMILTVCLPGIFTGEHSRRTDQLILVTAKGKDVLYRAKILVGVLFSLLAALVQTACTVIPSFVLYGCSGFSAKLQVIAPESVWSMTMGEALMIFTGLLFVMALLWGIVTMVLSECLKKGTAVMAVLFGFIVFSMLLNVPDEYRIAAQIWDATPLQLISYWGVFTNRLFPLLGHYFTSWQAVPVVYLLLSALAARAGKRRYTGFQVSGR